jgi:hypothetical protein
MTAALLALSLATAPWDGASPVSLGVGESRALIAPRPVRYVSIGASDIMELAVTKDLTTVQLRGIRPGARTVVIHYQDRTRVTVELRVDRPPLARRGRGTRR